MRKVLWICNIMLPVIAREFSLSYSNREGWLSGIFERVKEGEAPFTLSVCFPVTKEQMEVLPAEVLSDGVNVHGIRCFGFLEDLAHPETYDNSLEERFCRIFAADKPDMIHIFGTEFPHTLAAVRAFDNPKRTLIGIQGLCHEIARVYMADLPEKVQNMVTLRDFLRRDSLKQQQEKFIKRGEYEIEAIEKTGYITGRTAFDRRGTSYVNERAIYYRMNETMRDSFYEGEWDRNACEEHSIFLGQGDYPLKGLHFLLEAMPKILAMYPDTRLYVAGNRITAHHTLKEKIKLPAYGKYLLTLIRRYHLEDKVTFTGNLPEQEMKERFLKSHVFVCASVLENSPNTVGEAMLLGVPVAASWAGGIPDMITDGQEGLLFAKGDPEKLAEAVLRIFGDEAFCAKISEAEKRRARMAHNGVLNYERLLEIYKDICES